MFLYACKISSPIDKMNKNEIKTDFLNRFLNIKCIFSKSSLIRDFEVKWKNRLTFFPKRMGQLNSKMPYIIGSFYHQLYLIKVKIYN